MWLGVVMSVQIESFSIRNQELILTLIPNNEYVELKFQTRSFDIKDKTEVRISLDLATTPVEHEYTTRKAWQEFEPIDTSHLTPLLIKESKGIKSLESVNNDPETQLFISQQSAQLAKDNDCRYHMAIFSAYRSLEQRNKSYTHTSETILKSLISNTKQKEPRFLYIALYNMMLLQIFNGQETEFVDALNIMSARIKQNLNDPCLSSAIKYIVKIILLVSTYCYRAKSATKIAELNIYAFKLLKHSLANFPDEPDLIVLKDFHGPYNDLLSLQCFSKLANNSEAKSKLKQHFNFKNINEVEDRIINKALPSAECTSKLLQEKFSLFTYGYTNKIELDNNLPRTNETPTTKHSIDDANLLRDTAIMLEKTDLAKALNLMLLAQKARPDGTYINNKVKEYKIQLQRQTT